MTEHVPDAHWISRSPQKVSLWYLAVAVHEPAYFKVLLTVMVDPVKVSPFSKMSPVGVNHYGEDTI